MTAEKEALRDASQAGDYDELAEAYGWRGPEVTFGLSYAFTQRGESLIDIGIGTGLGSLLFHKAGLQVYGMDISAEMLEVCREKGFAAGLKEHDLTVEPYPYEDESFDHAICLGVMHFFDDLTPIFQQVARILRGGGVFSFVVADRESVEETWLAEDREQGQPDEIAVMHRHGPAQVEGLLAGHEFVLLRSLEFPVPMDRRRDRVFRAKAYVAERMKRA